MPTPIDVTTYEPRAATLRAPWPFTGRDEELDLVRRALAASRPGLVLTGPAGCGRTRLALEAVRGTDCARVAGTPETSGMPFAAFAHLLPADVTLHYAVQLLASVRLLLVDDAHLLDDASAALLHQLAVQGRTRLLVLVTDGAPAPGAVSRLWTGELLPRLMLAPLPHEETRHLLTAGADGPVEPITANRVLRLCRGDLRLLRDLLDALREQDLLTRGADTDAWTWRGRVPVTPALRERAAAVLARACPDERETLDRLAFAEPLPLPADTLDLRILEHLEADGLLDVTDGDTGTTVRLAHPLHGPVLRAAAGRLRARRLTGRRRPTAPALDAEAAELTHRIERADVRLTPTPVGEWLVAEGQPVPPWYAAVRARFSRLRGELREAAAWAREGLAGAPHDHACRTELALAAAQSGETGALVDPLADHPGTAAWLPAARGDLDTARKTLDTDDSTDTIDTYDACDTGAAYDAVRLGAPERAVRLLPADGVFARHARALARGDGPALDLVAAELEERGFLLFAAEAHAQAASAHRDSSAARTARTRAVALARRCQGARTPALSGLVLGELTARQRQIVTLAAAGLSNRQIAERLTLSVRTVGNHLYGAYTRLGAGDREALPWLLEQPA
ncbi:DNA-binding response regulator, NarL/FixJ family, contains REC and HTH domains [Streptomyces sp. yr375]|uniref:LuxR family transcriptional regulator AbsR2 n=1 Tax=Streptomyces sp. yr375 TaxID=1761906 RepID=UPI0008B36AB5|nr:LuxR family transcriptional regulator [Streptomyces sp. yr375]SEP63725.1 DNA-binding response regulator, NarL/FixJ family, contains REC and HTH domains [Streptomyces sp. yr375]